MCTRLVSFHIDSQLPTLDTLGVKMLLEYGVRNKDFQYATPSLWHDGATKSADYGCCATDTFDCLPSPGLYDIVMRFHIPTANSLYRSLRV